MEIGPAKYDISREVPARTQVASEFFSVLEANHYDETTNLIFIEENHGSDSSFMFSSFIWKARMNDNVKIFLLTCHNSIQHYQHLLNKWGHVLGKGAHKSSIVNLSLNDYFDKNGNINIKKLSYTIYNYCQEFCNLKTYLMIDDLSYLLMLSSVRECVQFSRQLLKLLVDFKLLKIIVCGHVSKRDKEQLIISKLFQHYSNFVINIVPLKSGFSNEVTGHLRIIRKSNFRRIINQYNFKLDDKKFTLNPFVV